MRQVAFGGVPLQRRPTTYEYHRQSKQATPKLIRLVVGSRPLSFTHSEQGGPTNYGIYRPAFEAPPTPETALSGTPLVEEQLGRPVAAPTVRPTGLLCPPGMTVWPTPLDEISGTFLKNRFYGQSHWMSYLHKVRVSRDAVKFTFLWCAQVQYGNHVSYKC